MFVNKHFIILGVHISKSKRCYNAKPSAYYFYVKTKLSVDFRICISVPLRKGYILYFPSTHSMYYGTNSVHFLGSLIWNNLRRGIKCSKSESQFKIKFNPLVLEVH